MANVRHVNYTPVFDGGARLPAGAAAGLVAQSDASGNISWVSPALVWKAVEEVNANLTNPASAEWSTLKCAIDIFGVVHLAGSVKASAELATKSVLFKLPVSCRPEKLRGIIVMSSITAGTSHNLIIKTNGEVECILAFKVAEQFIFDSVQFPIGPA